MLLDSPPTAAAFERWLRGQRGFEQARVRSLLPVDGGASNITCRADLTDAPVERVALRLQRRRGIFEPYDVLREGAVLRRLSGSHIPVPGVLLEERDGTHLGAPFLVLEWIDAPHMGEAGADADFGAYVSMVAAIHDVDWKSAGIEEVLDIPPEPLEGCLREVEAVAKRMASFVPEGDRFLERAHEHLRETAPGDGELRLCQGDINVFNYLFRAGQVVGVVDWEQARIGDCRSDVGQLVALAHLKGAPFGPAETQPFVQAYGMASGRPLTGMAWFRAFWAWQLAVIHHGWVAFNGTDPWYTRAQVYELLEASLAEV